MCNSEMVLRWFCFPNSILSTVILNNLACADYVYAKYMSSVRVLENMTYNENHIISQTNKDTYNQKC